MDPGRNSRTQSAALEHARGRAPRPRPGAGTNTGPDAPGLALSGPNFCFKRPCAGRARATGLSSLRLRLGHKLKKGTFDFRRAQVYCPRKRFTL